MSSVNNGGRSSGIMAGLTGREYWRSLDHLADTPQFRQFMHREFPAGAGDLLDSDERRHFLKIMGASMALAGLGLAGCRRWPEEQIRPYASRPVGRDPGVPVRYATCMELAGVVSGLLATSSDGRPTKMEGNPEHPMSGGAADGIAQASVLDLYDPDRSRGVTRGGAASTWEEFEAWAGTHFEALGNGGQLAILGEASSSPSLAAMRQRLRERFPLARWYEYEPVNNDEEVAGAILAYGAPYRTVVDFERTRAIVSLDADFLGDPRMAVPSIRGFARGRNPDHMSRLTVVESNLSLTGANADHRIALRTSDVALAAAYLARIVVDDAALDLDHAPGWERVLTPAVRATLDQAADDLREHRGAGAVIAGPRQPAEVHYLAHLMNRELGNAGKTVRSLPRREESPHVESIRALVESGVDTLVILGGNPVYNAPADLGFAAWLGTVGASIHLGDYEDETATRCTWHLNRAHYLESWGDGRAWDGTLSICQPLIEPLFHGRTAIELIALLAGAETRSGMDIVRATFSEMVGDDGDRAWRKMLHDGFLAGSASTAEPMEARRGTLPAAADRLFARWSAGQDGWEITFRPDASIYDGRFANNGWGQERPDALTLLTWDNAAILGTRSARELGVKTGDMVRLQTADGATLEMPVLRQPGMPDRAVTVHLGYGRTFPGRICTGAGFDVYPLRRSAAMGFATGASVTRAAGSYVLARTQDHHAVDVETVGGHGLQTRLPTIYREATLAEYRDHPDFAAHRTHVVHRLSQWEESNLEGGNYAWAMSIDLNKCVGCGSCIAACQAENNIPVVGKDQVERGREMHWIRVDRYFRFARDEEGDGYDPNEVEAVALQPVLCMHCENAPCEQVCPVAATLHDKDGLNVMVYNRCVGTRYCANNCPYKVRRFNYFDYHRRKPHREQPGLFVVEPSYLTKRQATPDELLQLQFNPEVSVRMRGVMEKCSYCIQRISDAKIRAKNEFTQLPTAEKQRRAGDRVPVPDGWITPACAQTCPAEAIVFGDLDDPESRVTQLHADARTYEMLEELNVKARTRYMAKLRNPAGGAAGGHPGEAHDRERTGSSEDS